MNRNFNTQPRQYPNSVNVSPMRYSTTRNTPVYIEYPNPSLSNSQSNRSSIQTPDLNQNLSRATSTTNGLRKSQLPATMSNAKSLKESVLSAISPERKTMNQMTPSTGSPGLLNQSISRNSIASKQITGISPSPLTLKKDESPDEDISASILRTSTASNILNMSGHCRSRSAYLMGNQQGSIRTDPRETYQTPTKIDDSPGVKIKELNFSPSPDFLIALEKFSRSCQNQEPGPIFLDRCSITPIKQSTEAADNSQFGLQNSEIKWIISGNERNSPRNSSERNTAGPNNSIKSDYPNFSKSKSSAPILKLKDGINIDMAQTISLTDIHPMNNTKPNNTNVSQFYPEIIEEESSPIRKNEPNEYWNNQQIPDNKTKSFKSSGNRERMLSLGERPSYLNPNNPEYVDNNKVLGKSTSSSSLKKPQYYEDNIKNSERPSIDSINQPYGKNSVRFSQEPISNDDTRNTISVAKIFENPLYSQQVFQQKNMHPNRDTLSQKGSIMNQSQVDGCGEDKKVYPQLVTIGKLKSSMKFSPGF